MILFCVLGTVLFSSCSLMTEPPLNQAYRFVDTWGKDYAGSIGPGHGDGTSGSAPGAFNTPVKTVVLPGGKVIVLDAGNHRIQKFNADGTPSLFADQTEAWGNSFGAEGLADGEFLSPSDMAADSSGNIFVADSEIPRVQVFSSAGTFRTQFCVMKAGSVWPTNTPGGYLRPVAVAVDGSGRLYVADTLRKSIDRYTSSFLLDSAWGSSGSLQREEFGRIEAMECSGNALFLLERTGIRVLSLATGSETDNFDAFGYGKGRLSSASGMAVWDGKIFVTDGSDVKIFSDGFDYEAVFCGITGSKPGEVLAPSGLAVSGSRAYLCDTDNHRIQVFEKAE